MYVGSMQRHMIYYSMLLRPNVCFFYRTHSTLFDKDTQIMGNPIGFVDKCKFLCFSISPDILNRDTQSSINTFNRKCMKLDYIFPF